MGIVEPLPILREYKHLSPVNGQRSIGGWNLADSVPLDQIGPRVKGEAG